LTVTAGVSAVVSGTFCTGSFAVAAAAGGDAGTDTGLFALVAGWAG
jgi:hypothetical protein